MSRPAVGGAAVLSSLRRQTWVLAAIVFVVLFAVNAILQPRLLEPAVMTTTLQTALPLILIAIGQTYVVLAGDIDLSVGSIVSLVNVSVVTLFMAWGDGPLGILGAMAAGIAIGVACGVANGIAVAVLRFQPIVATFATAIVIAGIALWVLPQAGGQAPTPYWRTYMGGLAGIGVVVWITLAALAFVLVFQRSRFYAQLMAVGGQRQAAYQSGLPVMGHRIRAYALSGLFAGLTALCLTAETASGDPLSGQALTLQSVTAVVLGGTALAGGIGGAVGSMIGAVVLILIRNLIFFARLPFEVQALVEGLIILAVLAGGVLMTRRAAR